METKLKVAGFQIPDKKWFLMKGVLDACAAAEIDPPGIACKYFDNSISLELPEVDISTAVGSFFENGKSTKSGRHEAGIEIDLHKIPAKVSIIRFWIEK